MCIAIYKPSDVLPDWDAYQNGHAYNNDSWGWAVADDGQLLCDWGIGTFDEFRESFEPYSMLPAAVHFRIATSGKIDLLNCHPFVVASDLAFIHNGIIDIKRSLNGNCSDTWHFNELILKAMHSRDPDFWLRPEVVATMNAAHADSKFVFLSADGRHCIWNEREGVREADGHWYSNSTFRASSSLRGWYYGGSVSHSVTVSAPSMSDDDTVVEDTEEQARVNESALATAYDSFVERCDAERAARSDWYYEEDERTHEDHWLVMMWQDLRAKGYSEDTLDEVFELQGYDGINALHNEL